MSASFLTCSDLTFAWPDGTPVFHDLSFTVGVGRTGLVAPNGAGKSTLLKLIAGEYRPARGSVTVDGVLGHLPQDLPLTGGLTVAEVLGVAPVIRALDAIESGDTREELFAVIGDDWDIEERTWAQLDPAVRGPVHYAAGSPSPCSSRTRRTCCCSTSRPTTSRPGSPTSRRKRWAPAPEPWWSPATTGG